MITTIVFTILYSIVLILESIAIGYAKEVTKESEYDL